jgi:hypothetical protein
MMEVDAMALPTLPREQAGLHSPPDSNSTIRDCSDSELSDLQPDLYQDPPTFGPQTPPQDSNDLRDVVPAEWSDEVGKSVPIFRPTMADFQDFEKCKFPSNLSKIFDPSYYAY